MSLNGDTDRAAFGVGAELAREKRQNNTFIQNKHVIVNDLREQACSYRMGLRPWLVDLLLQVLHLALQGGDVARGLDAEHVKLLVGRAVRGGRAAVLFALE